MKCLNEWMVESFQSTDGNTTDYHFISFLLGKKDGHIMVFNQLKLDIVLFSFVKNKGIR